MTLETDALGRLVRVTNTRRITLSLPWPDAKLSPNARTHWRVKSPIVKQHRQYAKVFTMASKQDDQRPDGTVSVTVTFHPPTNRKRDDDNCIGAFKSYRDGIADGLGVDDNTFRMTYNPLGEVVKGGAVEVEIEYDVLPFSEPARAA